MIPGPTADEIAQTVPEVQKRREVVNSTNPSSASSPRATYFPWSIFGRETSRLRADTVPGSASRIIRAFRKALYRWCESLPIQSTPSPGRQRHAARRPHRLEQTEPDRGAPFYRSRLDANRSALAQRGGASAASEQAVERALDWLARHQDADGRWDGGTARYDDGTAVKGDDDFTVHCPPGQTCFGECAYWEADTASPAWPCSPTWGRATRTRKASTRPRSARGWISCSPSRSPTATCEGSSKAVGMYCHAMATLALCEAYALSLDDRLRDPAERAVAFLVRPRPRRPGLAVRTGRTGRRHEHPRLGRDGPQVGPGGRPARSH